MQPESERERESAREREVTSVAHGFCSMTSRGGESVECMCVCANVLVCVVDHKDSRSHPAVCRPFGGRVPSC